MSLVTVSEIVRFALPPGSVLLAGSAGLGNAVTWARSLRARPATLNSVEQGEVWLLSSGALQQIGDPRTLARLARDVADAGVVALLAIQALPGEALAEAERIGLPIVALPSDASLSEVERSIVAFVVDRDRAIGTRVQEVYERLLATLVEDRGPTLLSDIVHTETGKAVYLLDEHFQPMVQTGGSERTAEGLGDLRRRSWEGGLGALLDRLVPLRLADGNRSLGALVRPVQLHGATEGYLALLGERDEFGDFDRLVAERTASVVAIELAKQAAVVEARLRVQGDFLADLLDQPRQPSEQIVARGRALGYDLSQPHLVFVLGLAGPAGQLAQPRLTQRFLDNTRRRLAATTLAALLRPHGTSMQVLLPLPGELAGKSVEQVTRWVDQLRQELEQALAPEEVLLAGGIGRMPDGPITYHQALREAMQAVEIAATLPVQARTLHFASLGAMRLVFHLKEHPELQAYLRDTLGPLESSDRAGRSEFVQTLDAFFRASGNHVQAARDLHVHRNTLIYRLERIRDLLGGLDLEDPDVRLNLQLALKVRSIVGAAA